MRYIPDYNLNILSEEDFPSAIVEIGRKLDRCRHSGFFDTFDGKKIFYEYFLTENSHSSVVVVHGLSEFTKKYYEFTNYLLNQGYNVFLYDQRCHGYSDRLADRPELIHIDCFDDLVADLATYIETIVKPADPKPLYLYAHSMGGAVGLLYLSKHPDTFQKAVLSSPLIAPITSNLPEFPFRWGTAIGGRLVGTKAKFYFSNEYNPDITYDDIPRGSRNRVSHTLNMRRSEPRYQSTPMTLGCVYNTLILRKRLLHRRFTDSIQTPVLMLCAETDTMVKLKPQKQFAEKCGACQRVVVPHSNHAMLTDDSSILTEHITRALDFYRP